MTPASVSTAVGSMNTTSATTARSANSLSTGHHLSRLVRIARVDRGRRRASRPAMWAAWSALTRIRSPSPEYASSQSGSCAHNVAPPFPPWTSWVQASSRRYLDRGGSGPRLPSSAARRTRVFALIARLPDIGGSAGRPRHAWPGRPTTSVPQRGVDRAAPRAAPVTPARPRPPHSEDSSAGSVRRPGSRRLACRAEAAGDRTDPTPRSAPPQQKCAPRVSTMTV